MNEYETFYDDVKETTQGTYYITIKKEVIKFMGLQKGDQVKAMIQKKVEE
jgi:hypothetical protein